MKTLRYLQTLRPRAVARLFPSTSFLFVCLLTALPDSLPAAEADTADRGPTFSGTILAKYPGSNPTMKGIVVALGEQTNAFICYDTDLMRVSVAWTGAYLNFDNYMREISHPQPPRVAGDVVFGTRPGPGWAYGGKFGDPRPNQQGPLPAHWAKHRGIYLHKRQVVLSYTVGETHVLESPGLEVQAGLTLFTRTFQFNQPSAQTFLVCEGLPAGVSGKAASDRAVLKFEQVDSPRGPVQLAVALLGAPEAQLEASGGRVVVQTSGKEKSGLSFTVALWSGSKEDGTRFESAVKALAGPSALQPLTKGGPPRWNEPVITRGTLATSGDNGPYVVDYLAEPVPNPWKANTFFGGFDFFPDGRAALCTFHGDVWVVSGLDAKLEKLTWRRYATGLFQPLGLKVVEDKIYVVGRDQLTRLHDLNGDGEADFYENFNNDTVVSPNYHEFCLDLQTDRAGNFYYAKGSPWTPDVRTPHQGTMLKVSKDGSKLEVFATGFRAPNGSGMGPNDELTVSDNQGHWMPASKLNLVKPGGFYGMTPAAHRELTLRRDGTNITVDPSNPEARARLKLPPFDGLAPIPDHYDQPVAWLPMNMDNSSGGQVWVTSERWGPLKNHMLFMSYGRGTLLHVLMDEIDGESQAAMVRFPLKFQTGLMRGRCHPVDGQIYVSGLRGWQTDGTRNGGFYRVRYTGKARPYRKTVSSHARRLAHRIHWRAGFCLGQATLPTTPSKNGITSTPAAMVPLNSLWPIRRSRSMTNSR
jgi:hypothetical protein